MTFQIHALPVSLFLSLFKLTDKELMAQNIRRIHVDNDLGFPCRVSLADARIGETVLLLNYEHQPHPTPYQASHAIFVRENVEQYYPALDEIPASLSIRLLSIRAFDSTHQMISAEVVDGKDLAAQIQIMFTDENIAYLHIHNAKPGCFAASVTRN